MKSSISRPKISPFLIWLYISLNWGISISPARFLPTEISIWGNVKWVCSTYANCTTPKSFCSSGWCRCPWDYVFNAPMTACVEVATAYGDKCEETSQCVAYLSIGGKCVDGACKCDTGFHYLHGQCFKSSGFGEQCSNDHQCNVNGDFEALSCIHGFCNCGRGFYQREYRTCRREANAIGAECTIDLDCRFGKHARCDPTKGCYVSYEGEQNNVEDKMSNDVFWEHQIPRHSDLELLPDMNCTKDKDCAKYGPASCFRGCVCHRGFAFDSDKKKCIPELGETCVKGATVTIPNSKCRDGHWSCSGARVASTNNRICRKATTKFNAPCQYNEQCYAFGPDSVCVDKHCVCNEKSHYVEEEMFCWVNRGYGESCKTNKDCHVPNFHSKLICSKNSICECPVGTHLNWAGTGCVDDSPVLGGFCSANFDCKSLNNAHCHEERCSCVDTHFEAFGLCVAGIKASCTTDPDCYTPNSICDSYICTCEDGFVSPSSDLCVPVSQFGGECQYDIQCSVSVTDARCFKPEVAEPSVSMATGSSPLNGTCNCEAGHYERYNKCHVKRVLDETCTSKGECYVTSDPDSVHCLKGVCTCDFDAKRINSTFCQNDASTTIAISILLIPSMLFVTSLTS